MKQQTTHARITSGLKFTATCSQLGLIAFCFVGLISTEMTFIPQSLRLWIVAAGALFAAIGAEGGSRYSIAASFERNAKLSRFDVAGIFISQLSTITTIITGFRTLSGAGVGIWLYIANVIFVGLDATFNYAALGIHLRNGRKLQAKEQKRRLKYEQSRVDIERQLFALRAQEAMYTENHETSPMAPVDAPVAQNGAPLHTTGDESGDNGAPAATTPAKVAHQYEPLRNASISDWRELLPTLSTRPTTGDEVNSALVAHGFAEKPQTTANRWAKDAAV